MITLLGGSGYVGGAFQAALKAQGATFINLTRAVVNYSNTAELTAHLKSSGTQFLINCAGFTGKPNVDACEAQQTETLFGNAVLPGRIAQACEAAGIRWGHVSSGCIYNGNSASGAGFTEEDAPNFSFRHGPCSYYSGSKAMGEEILQNFENVYIWRLRIPFNNVESPRNYLTKLVRYKRLLEAENSISHLGEFASCCLQSYQQNLPTGTYNLTNPGSITTRHITQWMLEEGQRREAAGMENPFPKGFDFFESEDEFMQTAAKTPRSNCVLNTEKAEAAGLRMAPAEEAVKAALANWVTEGESAQAG